jgi:hypothetical protein
MLSSCFFSFILLYEGCSLAPFFYVHPVFPICQEKVCKRFHFFRIAVQNRVDLFISLFYNTFLQKNVGIDFRLAGHDHCIGFLGAVVELESVYIGKTLVA